MKRVFLFCLVVVHLLSCFFAVPLSAFAFVNQGDNTEATQVEIHKVVNSEVVLMAEEIASLEVITEEDIRWIERDFGKVTYETLTDDLTMVKIDPYSPESIEQCYAAGSRSPVSSALVERYRTIGIVQHGSGGYWVERAVEPGTIVARLGLCFDRATLDTVEYYKVVNGTTEILDIYDGAQITDVSSTLGLMGLNYGTSRSDIFPQAWSQEEAYKTEHFVDSTGEMVIQSPSEGYWRMQWLLGSPLSKVELITTFTYLRGETSYSRSLSLSL